MNDRLPVLLDPAELGVLSACQAVLCDHLRAEGQISYAEPPLPAAQTITVSERLGDQMVVAAAQPDEPLRFTRAEWVLVLYWVTWALETRRLARNVGEPVEEQEPLFLATVTAAQTKIRAIVGAH